MASWLLLEAGRVPPTAADAHHARNFRYLSSHSCRTVTCRRCALERVLLVAAHYLGRSGDARRESECIWQVFGNFLTYATLPVKLRVTTKA